MLSKIICIYYPNDKQVFTVLSLAKNALKISHKTVLDLKFHFKFKENFFYTLSITSSSFEQTEKISNYLLSTVKNE